MKKIVKILKKILHQIRFRIELKIMDDVWDFMGGYCFGIFPPSFYYTHTEEEIKRITAEKIENLQKIADLTFQQLDPH